MECKDCEHRLSFAACELGTGLCHHCGHKRYAFHIPNSTAHFKPEKLKEPDTHQYVALEVLLRLLDTQAETCKVIDRYTAASERNTAAVNELAELARRPPVIRETADHYRQPTTDP